MYVFVNERSGSRQGELRSRSKGRPDTGGAVLPPTGNAFMVSEYLHQCLAIYLNGQGLWAEQKRVQAFH